MSNNEDRRKRLAQTLRDNLRRRKGQSRESAAREKEAESEKAGE